MSQPASRDEIVAFADTCRHQHAEQCLDRRRVRTQSHCIAPPPTARAPHPRQHTAAHSLGAVTCGVLSVSAGRLCGQGRIHQAVRARHISVSRRGRVHLAALQSHTPLGSFCVCGNRVSCKPHRQRKWLLARIVGALKPICWICPSQVSAPPGPVGER